jgi:outer membrane protein TolC
MKATFFLTIWAAVTIAASAQTGSPEIRKLSLDDCIAIALQHNFDVQITRYEPQKARFSLAGSYGVYDPTFSLTGEHQYSLSPGGIDSQGRAFGGTEVDADVFSANLSGLLPWGTVYNLGGNTSDRTGTRPAVTINPSSPILVTNQFFDPVANAPVVLLSTNFATINTRTPFETTDANAAALSLTQPLLKNFWIDAPRYAIYASKRNVKVTESSFRSQVMITMTDVEQAYFNLVFAEDFVTVQEEALKLARQSLDETKKRVSVGALAQLDEKQSEAQAASSEAALLAAQADRDTAQRVLKNLLSDDYTNNWAQASIVPTDRMLAMPQQFNLQESWRKGMAQSPQLINLRLNVDVAKYNVKLTRNQLLPELDVVGSYGYTASGKEYSDAFGQIGDRSFPYWSVGGQVSVPLSRTSARSNFKSAKASEEQLGLQLKQAEQALLILIENDIASARANFELVDATHLATRYAEEALQAEQKKLENGKSTSFEVLSLQSKLTTARANEIRALADYNIRLALLALHEGSTLERHRVNLNISTLETKPGGSTGGNGGNGANDGK